MDDHTDQKLDPVPAEFATESTWPLGGDSDNNGYFFGADRESSILSEFGWNLQPDAEEQRGRELDRIGFDVLAGSSSGGNVTPLENSEVAPPSVARQVGPASTSSSDDPAEIATVSDSGGGGSVANLPSDITCKVKKKGQKRMRQPRFAFMTKSEVDHLEDGYRWRKYGQKAVKNSPFPRSYYRCTNSKCSVKKRVERSYEDPTIVITTYEGQHCHHSAGFSRGGLNITHESSAFANNNHFTPSVASQFHYPAGVLLSQESSIGRSQPYHQVPEDPKPPPADDGLLGDIVPGMRNREI